MKRKVSNSIRTAWSGVQPSRGFTLVELLVVLAVIGILAGMFLPSLSNARSKGQSLACLNNHRQLSLASFLYVNDHSDSLPYNLGASATKKTVADGTFLNWVNNVMSWELHSENTNTALIAAGGLGPYTRGTPLIYRCPADFVLSKIQQDAGWESRVRSISMNAMVGNAGDFISSGTNVNNPGYRQFFRSAEILEPWRIFVFIEEHPDSINDGYFLNKAQNHEWIDLPATYHQGTANLAFADGHAEKHKWLNNSTKPPSKPGAAALPAAVPDSELEDFYWLMQRMSRKNYQKTSSSSN